MPCSSFDNPRQNRKSLSKPAGKSGTDASEMDKIAGLREILAADPGNSLARYAIAMELASHGDTAAALVEFDTLLANDPSHTAGYFMSAQALAKLGRKAESVERLKAGKSCAAREGNNHAVSEMQAMLDQLNG
jgi:predicted Zn-dependent protease